MNYIAKDEFTHYSLCLYKQVLGRILIMLYAIVYEANTSASAAEVLQ